MDLSVPLRVRLPFAMAKFRLSPLSPYFLHSFTTQRDFNMSTSVNAQSVAKTKKAPFSDPCTNKLCTIPPGEFHESRKDWYNCTRKQKRRDEAKEKAEMQPKKAPRRPPINQAVIEALKFATRDTGGQGFGWVPLIKSFGSKFETVPKLDVLSWTVNNQFMAKACPELSTVGPTHFPGGYAQIYSRMSNHHFIADFMELEDKDSSVMVHNCTDVEPMPSSFELRSKAIEAFIRGSNSTPYAVYNIPPGESLRASGIQQWNWHMLYPNGSQKITPQWDVYTNMASPGAVCDLHSDPPGLFITMCLAMGQKIVFSCPPTTIHNLGSHSVLPKDNLRSLLADPDRMRGQLYATVLEAGDCLILPPGWWHATITTQTSILSGPHVYATSERACEEVEGQYAFWMQHGADSPSHNMPTVDIFKKEYQVWKTLVSPEPIRKGRGGRK